MTHVRVSVLARGFTRCQCLVTLTPADYDVILLDTGNGTNDGSNGRILLSSMKIQGSI